MPPWTTRSAIAIATGAATAVALDAVVGHGAPSNRRWRVKFDDGRPRSRRSPPSTTRPIGCGLEHANYEALAGQTYLAPSWAGTTTGRHPALVIEDLSERRLAAAVDDRADRRRARCAERDPGDAAARPRSRTSSARCSTSRRDGTRCAPTRRGRSRSASSSRRWLETYADTLAAAAGSADLERRRPAARRRAERQPVLPRRPCSARRLELGLPRSPTLDVLSWLPSLHHEGGPEPWAAAARPRDARRAPRGVLPRARRREPIPQAPHVRQLQLDQGRGRAARGRVASWASPPPSDAAGSCTCNTLLHSPPWPNRPRRLRRRARPAPQQGPAHDPAAPGDRLGGDADAGPHLAGRDRPHDRG